MSPLKLFISYSHQDEGYLHEFEKHLSALKREALIDTWHDRKITPGHEWERKIEDALDNADIYIFLISPDFVASEYCIETEVVRALEKHKDGSAIVIPIVVRSADWLSTPLGKIQALPKDATPIYSCRDKDLAWLEVVKGIRIAISDLSKKTLPSQGVHISDMPSALTAMVETIEMRYSANTNVGGLQTGLHDFDQLIDGIHQGDLICVAAAPVMDRLAFLIQIINSVCVKGGHSGLIVTLRKTQEDIARRMCAAIGNLSVHALRRGRLADDDWGNLTHALGQVNDAKIGFVEQTTIDVNVLIRSIDEFIKRHHGCDLVVVDHFDQVAGGSKPGLLSKLGLYARKNKVPIVVAMGLETDPSVRPNKRPILNDLGDWAVLNEDLDTIVFLYQDGQYYPDSLEKGVAELIVAKNSRGSLGTADVRYSNESQALTNKIRRRQS